MSTPETQAQGQGSPSDNGAGSLPRSILFRQNYGVIQSGLRFSKGSVANRTIHPIFSSRPTMSFE